MRTTWRRLTRLRIEGVHSGADLRSFIFPDCSSQLIPALHTVSPTSSPIHTVR